MKYSVATLDGDLIAFRHHNGLYPQMQPTTKGSFEEALALAEEHGNCLVVELRPVLRVTTERFTRCHIDPLL